MIRALTVSSREGQEAPTPLLILFSYHSIMYAELSQVLSHSSCKKYCVTLGTEDSCSQGAQWKQQLLCISSDASTDSQRASQCQCTSYRFSLPLWQTPVESATQ